jgi:Tol biopolymer transport system component
MKPILRIASTIVLICFLLSSLSSCNDTTTQQPATTNIPYPQPLPDSTALIFLPGIVSKDSFDFNAAFSPDGKFYYFSRTMNKQSKIYVSHHNGTTWDEPVLLSNVEVSYSDADPAFAPDGKLYFISNRPKDQSDTLKDYDLYSITPLPNGTWTKPEYLQNINTDSNDYYASFTTTGNLYFASSRNGGFGKEDIYVSKLINGQYATPENLGAAINTPNSEFDPGISAKEDMLLFASSGREDGFGAADLYYARPGANNQWQPAINLGPKFNTQTRDFCPYISPDGQYFFYSSEREIKWISTRYLPK